MSVYDQTNLVNLGNDLAISQGEEGGALLLTASGDLATVKQLDNLASALKRRFYTAYGAYGTICADYTGLIYQDYNYGSKLFNLLSENISNSLIANLKDLTRQVFNQEPRVSLSNISIEITKNNIFIYCDYIVLQTKTSANIVFSYDPNQEPVV